MAGTGLAFYVLIPLTLALCILIVSFAGMVLLHFYYYSWHPARLFGILLNILLFTGGNALYQHQDARNGKAYFASDEPSGKLLVMLDDNGKESRTGTRYTAKVLAVATLPNKPVPASGTLLITIRHSGKTTLQYGDVLVLDSKDVKETRKPMNPGQLDYKTYLSHRNIYHTATVNSENCTPTGINKGLMIRILAYTLQHTVSTIFGRTLRNSNRTGIAEALIYGNDDHIEKETIGKFARTGTLHVLAVSGMHVGLIFWMLSTLLRRLNSSVIRNRIRQIGILSGLWFYATLCGLTPSVLRATVMFSFILFGDLINRKGNIYNTLAASAFVLLLSDTRMLASTGFQLSYLAVAGIVTFQPVLYKEQMLRFWLPDQVWKICAVSIAAQLTTFPLSLYSFHQFPVCFVFTNLLIIPLTTGAIYVALLHLVLAAVHPVSAYSGQLLSAIIDTTNSITDYFDSLPWSCINGIAISPIQSILLYGIIISLGAFTVVRKPVYLFGMLTFLACLTASDMVRKFSLSDRNRICIYHSPASTAIRLIRATNSLLLTDNIPDSGLSQILNRHREKMQLKAETCSTLSPAWHVFRIQEKQFLITGEGKPSVDLPCVDYLIVRNNTTPEVLSRYNPAKVILLSTLNRAYRKRLNAYFRLHKIPCCDISESGAFELNLHE